MVLSFVYWSLRRLLELVVLRRRSEREKEIEILLLRHQLRVLQRQAARPQLTQADRALLAAFSRRGERGGGRCSSRQRPLCAGIASLSRAAGRIRIGVPDARRLPRTYVSSWCGLRGRTRAGDTGGSRASWSGSESSWPRAPSGRF